MNTDGNPLLGKLDKQRIAYGEPVMTLNGTIHKTGFLMLLVLMPAMWAFTVSGAENAGTFGWAALVGFLLALVVIFVPTTAWFLAPIYAVCEGLALGGVSKIFDMKHPGIAAEAMVGTMGVLLTMIVLYRFKIVKYSNGLLMGLVAAMFGILALYLANIFLPMFGGPQVEIVDGNSKWAVAFSVGVCIVAALNFVIDFHQIEDGVDKRAPKHMEWYAAFCIIVTLVWLYVEILRLLRKIKD